MMQTEESGRWDYENFRHGRFLYDACEQHWLSLEGFGAHIRMLISSTALNRTYLLSIEATEIVGRWKKRRKKDCTGARPHNRLGPVGPF
jgi:hypothetical protein